jgi:hypothetical protein
MAVASVTTGSSLATTGSEMIVTTQSTAGVYTFHVDMSVLTSTDVCELRIYQMITAGSTAKVTYFMPYYGAQPTDDTIKISVPVANDVASGLQFSIKQTYGTARTYAWKVLSY